MSPYEFTNDNGHSVNTVVPLEEYERLLLSTAQSKRASRRANLASQEAKEVGRRRRERSVFTEGGEDDNEENVYGIGNNTSSSSITNSNIALQDGNENFLKLLQDHERTLTVHSQSLGKKIQNVIAVQHKALPLRFLFTVRGGADYCKLRLRAALGNWIRGFEKAQMTVAVGLLKINMDNIRKEEMTLVYRQQAGRRLLKVIILEIDLRLYKRTFGRWNRITAWMIYKERDEAATRIQATVLRYNGLCEFIRLHDECPIGGRLRDIPLEPYRKDIPGEESKGVTCRIYPRVRTEKRRFWNASLLIETRYRMVKVRKHFLLMQVSSIICESVWRMYAKRKEYMVLRSYAIVLESMARMVVKKWQYRRLRVASFVGQRIYRGHLARMEFIRRQKARRTRLEVSERNAASEPQHEDENTRDESTPAQNVTD